MAAVTKLRARMVFPLCEIVLRFKCGRLIQLSWDELMYGLEHIQVLQIGHSKLLAQPIAANVLSSTSTCEVRSNHQPCQLILSQLRDHWFEVVEPQRLETKLRSCLWCSTWHGLRQRLRT